MTMPIKNVFRNSAYYWGFGLLVGYVINQPAAQDIAMWHVQIGLPLMALFILTNFACHFQLSKLRKPGSQELSLPKGGLFEVLVAPNYVAEIMTWAAFKVMTGFSWAGILFNMAGLYQMHQWVAEKRARYRKEFKDFPARRKLLIPFVY